MKPIHLDGRSLTREQLVAVAYGATVELDAGQMRAVKRAADFLDEQVRLQEPYEEPREQLARAIKAKLEPDA